MIWYYMLELAFVSDPSRTRKRSTLGPTGIASLSSSQFHPQARQTKSDQWLSDRPGIPKQIATLEGGSWSEWAIQHAGKGPCKENASGHIFRNLVNMCEWPLCSNTSSISFWPRPRLRPKLDLDFTCWVQTQNHSLSAPMPHRGSMPGVHSHQVLWRFMMIYVCRFKVLICYMDCPTLPEFWAKTADSRRQSG
jgi:hypothetical protein